MKETNTKLSKNPTKPKPKTITKNIRILVHNRRWYHFIPDAIRSIWRSVAEHKSIENKTSKLFNISLMINLTDTFKIGTCSDLKISDVTVLQNLKINCDSCYLYLKGEDVCNHEEYECATHKDSLGLPHPVWCPLNIEINKTNKTNETKGEK